jgi:uncharacterized coiled-coil DUF342 family protein
MTVHIMVQADYRAALDAAAKELENVTRQRDALNVRMMQLQGTIRGLQALITHTNQADHAAQVELESIQLADAIMTVLRSMGRPMKAMEIRDALAQMGFDLDRFVNPLAAIHNAIKRLAESGQIQTLGRKTPLDAFRFGVR